MRAAWWAVPLSIVSLSASKACGQSEIPRLADLCTAPVSRIEGTRVAPSIEGSRMRGPAFSLIIPAGFAPVDVQGIDSKVGAWADSSGHAISYDYGAGMNLEYLRTRFVDFVECRDSIGGVPMLLTAGYDTAGRTYSLRGVPQYVVIAHWRELRPGPHMTVGVTSPDLAGLRRGLGVIRSVRFH